MKAIQHIPGLQNKVDMQVQENCQSSCPYTPQQNGTVERKYRHIFEVARALKFQSSVPIRFWGDCGYRLYDLESQRVFVRRDVTFKEHIFPIKEGMQIAKDLFPSDTPSVVPAELMLEQPDHHLNTEEQIPNEGMAASDSEAIPAVVDSEQVVTLIAESDDADTVQQSAPLVEVQADTSQLAVEGILEDNLHTRKSNKVSRPSIWLKDYITTCNSQNKPHYISNSSAYNHLSNNYRAYLGVFATEVEPKSFKEACKDKNWIEAMSQEIKALEDNATWKIVDLPVELIEEVKQTLHNTFKVKNLGELRYFLGIEVLRLKEGILLTQRKYALQLISEVGLAAAKLISTPIELNQKLSTIDYNKHVGVKGDDELEDIGSYQRLIGKLLYLTITRPDLSFAIQDAALRVVRYVKSAPGFGVFLSTGPINSLSPYCDSNWASCANTRRSVTGYIFKLGDSLLSWKSKKQQTVSRSSVEAEYRSRAATSAEITWFLGLLKELQVHVHQSVPKAALQIAINPIFHERTKNIEIDCHFVRDKIKTG
ncbi:uncharacterized protein [Nicotiana tomentosiformis]|uniref:uncharacterized protein n=1 Tax=Nicotiana tomentosiformis TaxID=4098 RepID=UPI00388C574A